ncbi:MAG: MmgE/PrpD family protein, partial [Nitrososphaeria archaeon]|nr:MmgE/PrpD family protein [Nitrososphaeria archaeon]NIQ32537.1 MmgE/PrpD family protein [Nitrososphaeria archaeon]
MRQEVTKTLADFASSVRFSDLPEEALRHSKKCILDLLGVALAGSMTIPGRIIIDFVKKLGGEPEATVISSPLMVPCTNAALANGTLAHALELDDGSRYAMGHPGVVVIPAALAAAESNDVSGKDLITAVVLGYETFIRLGSAVNPSHFRRGFHTTGTCGTFAAAVAAGKILGLDEDGMANALGLAGTQSAGLFEFVSDGSMSKPLHPGRSAQSGVLAVL